MIRSFNGKTPQIASSAFISEAAYIVGDVEIGENSGVWPGAVIRGDFGKIKIGRNVQVEDNCVIHSGLADVMIKDNAIIGHGSIIDSGTIGNNTLTGINSTILHYAEIGDFCIVAAGCMVGQGMKIPDGSLVVGVPGKIKCKVSEELLSWVQQGPEDYVKLARQYKEQGF